MILTELRSPDLPKSDNTETEYTVATVYCKKI